MTRCDGDKIDAFVRAREDARGRARRRARWAMTMDRGVIVLTRMLTWKMRRATDATDTTTTRRMGRLNRSVKEF